MLRRRHYLALGIVVLVTLVVWNLPSGTATRLKLGIGSLFVPLFGLANSSHKLATKAGDAAFSRSELLRQNETLRKQNQELLLQAAQAESMARENDRLRQLFAWQRQQRRNYKLGNVVLREPSNWWRTVQIDLGTRDGISNNLPVLTTDGLVGRIASVSLTRSQVVLLGDPNCKVAARVENETRDTGVIGPSGALDREFVELGFLSRNANLKAGQTVRTSGHGGIFPKDILIGTVVESHPVEYGLYSVAQVKLAANLNSLEEVWVMLNQ
jgi:rod shape-determining protein MreC